MSDTESFRSAHREKSINHPGDISDEQLNDHRQQIPSIASNKGDEGISGSLTDKEQAKVHYSEETNTARNRAIVRKASNFEEEKAVEAAPMGRFDQVGRGRSSIDASFASDEMSSEDPLHHGRKSHQYMNSLRKEFYLRNEEEEQDSSFFTPRELASDTFKTTPNFTLASSGQPGAKQELNSFSNEPKEIKGRRKSQDASVHKTPMTGSILMNSSNYKKGRSRGETNEFLSLGRVKTSESAMSDRFSFSRDRRPSKTSIDLDVDSRASRSSQETEEDVCFPIRDDVATNKIDFEEIDSFVQDELEFQREFKQEQKVHTVGANIHMRNTSAYARRSSNRSENALRYTPKFLLKKNGRFPGWGKFRKHPSEPIEEPVSDSTSETSSRNEKAKLEAENSGNGDDSSESVKFGGIRVNNDIELPNRFSFFCSESDETIHAPDIPSLFRPGQKAKDLFRNGAPTWWLDCSCPTDAEMKAISKAFGIHPLTAEDIRMQEAREKVELFRNYYFVSFHTFDPDSESEEYLEPINVYMVVFREGILSFHFAPIAHSVNVRRRVRQLRDYVDVSADWICYALIDDITDFFAPVITEVEYEADSIEDSVFVARNLDFRKMLLRIGEARKKVMTLMRLLSGKADVIRMFAKRCYDAQSNFPQVHSSLSATAGAPPPHPPPAASHNPSAGFNSASMLSVPGLNTSSYARTQPRADIALYLGDIQDHIITMFQSLSAYEKIFSRSHANYLAQLQVESVNSNNNVTNLLSKVTILGTILVPLNVITGLFGMNVTIPGENSSHKGLGWFFGIIGVMAVIVIICYTLANLWLKSAHRRPEDDEEITHLSLRRRSLTSLRHFRLQRDTVKSVLSYSARSQ